MRPAKRPLSLQHRGARRSPRAGGPAAGRAALDPRHIVSAGRGPDCAGSVRAPRGR
jgi:hypothetical protein